MSKDQQTSFETTNNKNCPSGGSMLGKRVNTVEAGMCVNTAIDQAKGLKKIVNRPNFLYSVAINRTIHNLSTFEVIEYSDAAWTVIQGVHGKRADPISDFGIKIGCFVTATEMRFHAVIAILLKGMWKYMLRRPLWTWRLCIWHAAPFFSIDELELTGRKDETLQKGKRP